MAEDWAEHVDPASGRTYYYNSHTQVTSWDKPAELGGEVAVNDRWQCLTDPGSGREYFYDTVSGQTSWEEPEGWVSKTAGGAAKKTVKTSEEGAGTKKSATTRKTMLGRRSAIAKRSTAKPQTVAEKLAARAKKFVQLRKTEKQKNQPSAFARKRGSATGASTAVPGARPGGPAGGGATSGAAAVPVEVADAPAPAAASDWQALTTPEGQTYYYNATTGETSWELPA